MFEAEQRKIEEKIISIFNEENIPVFPIEWKWIPFGGHWGISTSFFQVAAAEARQGKKIVVGQRAQEIAEIVSSRIGLPQGFEKIEAVKGYLNLYFSTNEYARRVVDIVLNDKDRFGRGPRNGEQVMVEFSQPNTHKAFHVGHLRSAILGDALARIFDFAGFDTVRANYPGDMGRHVIIWLWCYMNFHAGEKPTKDITHWMGAVYVEARKKIEENPEIEEEIKALYKRWDERDPEIVKLWEETRQWSLNGFNELYSILDINFDKYYFNSQMEKPGKVLVDELIQRGIAQDERPEGPVIVKIDEKLGLDKEQYRVMVILRSDSTALYATEDLALTLKKFQDYPHLKCSYYVVDCRQSLHFQQVFKTMELGGYAQASQCEHIPYELVNLPGNVTMKSREGTVVLLEDLIREAIKRSLDVIREKNPDLPEEQMLEVAQAVGIGSLKYPMLCRENTKIVTFDWESALDFNGQAAPYIQYAHVRANSILRKVGRGIPEPVQPEYTLTPSEVQLIELLSRLPREVQRAAAEFKPLYVASLSFEIGRAFSEFYRDCPVLQADENTKDFRLRLVAATKQTLANCLSLLGIKAPEVM